VTQQAMPRSSNAGIVKTPAIKNEGLATNQPAVFFTGEE
jgi:hypothetical protein